MKVKHRNVLPFLGFAVIDNTICFISKWMENGAMREYLAKNPDASRLELVVVLL